MCKEGAHPSLGCALVFCGGLSYFVQHVLPDVMEFRHETVAIRTMAPTEAQVTAFQAMWHLNPTAGAGESHTPPY